MSMKSVCPQCGMSMDGNVAFCPTCGSKMNAIDEPSATFENFNKDTNNTYDSENNFANDSFASNNEQSAASNPALNAAMNNSNPDLNGAMNNSAPDLDAAMNDGNNFNNAPNVGGGIPPIPPTYNQSNMNMGNGNIPPIQPGMNMFQPKPNTPSDTMALVGMILGIVSLCLCCFNLLDIPVAIAGLVLGILGVKSTKRKGMAIAGIVCSAIAILLCILVFVNGMEYSYSFGNDLEDILREYEDIYG